MPVESTAVSALAIRKRSAKSGALAVAAGKLIATRITNSARRLNLDPMESIAGNCCLILSPQLEGFWHASVLKMTDYCREIQN